MLNNLHTYYSKQLSCNHSNPALSVLFYF